MVSALRTSPSKLSINDFIWVFYFSAIRAYWHLISFYNPWITSFSWLFYSFRRLIMILVVWDCSYLKKGEFLSDDFYSEPALGSLNCLELSWCLDYYSKTFFYEIYSKSAEENPPLTILSVTKGYAIYLTGV